MLRNLFFAAWCVVLSAGAVGAQRAPVLVELFTSEGCSSCPPADRLLEQLDARAIVLSEHVDYWDRQGWKDRFSSFAFTQRQELYARLFRVERPYTPQMVVDGAIEFLGGDAQRAADEIALAAGQPKIDLRLARTASGVSVEIAAAPKSADVMLALAEASAQTHVGGGENKGLQLRHVAAVRSLRKIASVRRGERFTREIELPATAASQRVVVFLQESGQARVDAVALLRAGGE
jgi:hypothetical protein